MHLLPLLSTLTTPLTLTTANPIALLAGISPNAKQTPFKPVMTLQTVKDSCLLEIHGFAGCHKMVLVDKKRKCYELPTCKQYKGKTCGMGILQVDTHSRISLHFQHVGKGQTIMCEIQPKGPLAC